MCFIFRNVNPGQTLFKAEPPYSAQLAAPINFDNQVFDLKLTLLAPIYQAGLEDHLSVRTDAIRITTSAHPESWLRYSIHPISPLMLCQCEIDSRTSLGISIAPSWSSEVVTIVKAICTQRTLLFT